MAALVGLVVAAVLPGAPAASGASPQLRVTTPYPSIIVQPGSSASFDLVITVDVPRVVNLALAGVPEGWYATLQGGGFQIESIFVDPAVTEDKPGVKLDVQVPESATGTTKIAVTASADGFTDRLEVSLTVATGGGGAVTLEADFPSLRGRSDQTLTFSLTLRNETPQQLTFILASEGPSGWKVEARPASQPQAASFVVGSGSLETISVAVTPAENAPSNVYPVAVAATSGTIKKGIELQVEITGSVELNLTTPEGRLSTAVEANSTRDFQVVVANQGTAEATNVTLNASPPTGWTVTWAPETIPSIPAGQEVRVTATIRPSSDAIAGDYVITMRANATDSNDSMDIRITVETSPIWAFVAIGLIAATLAGLFLIFRRYGRR